MSSNYKEISGYNEEQLGKDRASRMSQVAMYSETAHFVYELLQNADDAEATEISFSVSQASLVVEHNGKPFTEDNVKAISYFGKGKTDITKIGHFGLGFKSVFAYTASPRVHSGDESFEITELYSLNEVHYPGDLQPGKTRFVFPFDHEIKKPDYIEKGKLKTPEIAYSEIAEKLSKLSAETLLFTKSLSEIRWEAEQHKGHYLREIKPVQTQDKDIVKEMYIVPSDVADYCYLITERTIEWPDDDGNKKEHRPVQIAFRLDKRLQDGGSIKKVENARLFVFFPTVIETHVGFILQGPYRTTPQRETVPTGDEFNRHVVEQSASLLSDSLGYLRDLGLLNVASYAALPLRAQDFQEGSLFRPVYDKVHEALKTKPLLPAHGGGFVCASEAKLARGKELVELFSAEQLGLLFDVGRLAWLHDEITTDSQPDLHAYLITLAEGMQVIPAALEKKLNANFLKIQPMDWLSKFIQYAMQGAQPLKKVPFIRLTSGEQVSLPADKNALPSAWFAPKDSAGLDLSAFPLVASELAANEQIRKLLEKEGIREIDAAAIVWKCILPLYNGVDTLFDESSYRDHLRQIRKAYTEANDAAKKQLTTNLDGAAWLACIHASGNAQDNIVWKKPGVSDVFTRTNDHELWFRGLDSVGAYFLHPSVGEELNGVAACLAKSCRHLWRSKKPDVPLDAPAPSDTTRISWAQNDYQEAQKGFHPHAEIYGLKEALNNLSAVRTQALWRILIDQPHLLRGVVLRAKSVGNLSSAPRAPEFSSAGKLLSRNSWLPNKEGRWHRPGELLPTDLPEEFETTSIPARDVAEKLEMKKPEVEQALDVVTNGDDDLKKLIAAYQSGPEAYREKLLKMIPQESLPQPVPSFKDGLANMTRQQRGVRSNDESSQPYPVSNTERYQKKLNQAVSGGVQEHATTPKTIRFSPVRDQPSNREARRILYEEYQGRCQITEETFPKASANANGEAENYFEACSLVPYVNADYFNDAGNMLCVSADTMAKLNHASFEWLDDIETKIEEFNNGGKTAQKIMIRIRLAGEDCVITWSQRHFMRLVALHQKA